MVSFITLLKREIARFWKVLIQTLLTPFVSAFLYMLIFGINLGSAMALKNGTPYLAYLIPGLMMMGIINNAYQNSSSSIVNMKFTGDLEDLRVVPLSNHQIVIALGLAALVRGAIVAIVTWLTGSIFLYWNHGYFLSVQDPLALLFFCMSSGLSFGFIGIVIAFKAKSFDQLSAFSTFILLPLIYLGGVFISVQKLSGVWRTVAELNPLLYFIEGLRYSFLGESEINLTKAILISLLSIATFYVLAYKSLKPGTFRRW